jgi:uncharacterized protein YcnI
MKKLIFFAAATVFIAFAAAQANAQTISLSVGKGTAARGATTRAYIVMEIPEGLHVNSFKPKSEYAIPTRASVSATGAKTGTVTYPAGKLKKFSFSNEPISVYEGRVVFGFNLTVPKGFSGRTVQVKATVRYQACTDEVCYAPKTKTVTLNVRVR